MLRAREDRALPADRAALPPGRATTATAHRPADRGGTPGGTHRKGRTMKTHVATAAALLVAASVSLDADRIRMRSGKVVEGMFIGGDSKNVRILLDDGSVSEVPLANAVAVEVSARKPPAPAAPAPATPPAAAPKPAASAAKAAPAPAPRPAVVVPAGTPVNVRLAQDIDVDVSQAGHRYKATVDDPVMVGGAIVIPRGAAAALQAVNVQQSGQMKGSDK